MEQKKQIISIIINAVVSIVSLLFGITIGSCC